MRVHFIHGFNITDGGEGTLGTLMDSLDLKGYETVLHDLGYIGLILLRCKNARLAEKIAEQVGENDVIVAHSNGCLITYKIVKILAKKGIHPKVVVTINAAMRRDAEWPEEIYILNLYSSKDFIVLLGSIWARLMSFGGLFTHGWGAAGRYGFTTEHSKLTNWDTAKWHWEEPTEGHSDLMEPDAVNYWSDKIEEYLTPILY